MRKYAAATYVLIIAAAGLFFLVKKDVIIPQLRMISPLNMTFLVAAVFFQQFMNALRFRYLLQVFGLVVPFREWFGLTVCNTMFSYYFPAKGGLAIRAVYLKQRYRFPYTSHVSLLVGAYLVCLILSAALGLFFLAVNYLFYEEWFPKLFFLFLFLFAATTGGAVVVSRLGGRNFHIRHGKVNEILMNFIKGMQYFRTNRKTVFKFGTFHLFSIFLLAVRLFLSFRALGLVVGPIKALIIQSLTGYSMVVSLTPGNLGIKEGIIAFSAGLMEISPDSAMLAAVLDRAVAIVVVFSLGLVFSHLLIKRLPETISAVPESGHSEMRE